MCGRTCVRDETYCGLRTRSSPCKSRTPPGYGHIGSRFVFKWQATVQGVLLSWTFSVLLLMAVPLPGGSPLPSLSRQEGIGIVSVIPVVSHPFPSMSLTSQVVCFHFLLRFFRRGVLGRCEGEIPPPRNSAEQGTVFQVCPVPQSSPAAHGWWGPRQRSRLWRQQR